MTQIDDVTLMAYADGELAAEEAARVAAAIEADPALKAKLARHHALRAEIKGAFDALDQTDLPAGLMDKLAARDNVVAFKAQAQASQKGWLWSRPMAIAATFLIAVSSVLMLQFMDQGDQLPPDVAGGPSLARGVAQVLNREPDGANVGGIQVEASFLADGDRFCRRFMVDAEPRQQGLACRNEGDRWQILALVPLENAYFPAGGDAKEVLEGMTRNARRLTAEETAGYLRR